MSLAAVPAYFIGRRMLRPSAAVVVAGLTVAVPSMVFTALVMRESVFYPLFLCVVLVIVRTLERPTVGAAVVALPRRRGGIRHAPQAIVILPAYLAAIVLKAWLDSRAVGQRRLHGVDPAPVRHDGRASSRSWTLAVAASVGRAGRIPAVLLGRYSALADGYSPVEIAPLDARQSCRPEPLRRGRRPGRLRPRRRPRIRPPRGEPPGERAFVAAAVPLVVLVLVQVGAFSTSPWAGSGFTIGTCSTSSRSCSSEPSRGSSKACRGLAG